MPTSLLDRAIYSYADVDRLVGLHAGTARRWLDGYTRGRTFYEPVLRAERTDQDLVTWGELVESRLLSEFRERRISIQQMRPAILRLREEFGKYPLAHARPLLEVDGRELVRRVQDEVGLEDSLQFVVVRNGQLLLTAGTERFRNSAEYDGGVVSVLRPSEATPDVVMDPQRSFGQPALRNVRTDVLAEDFRAGAGREELSELYDLTPDQVDQALRFELITARDHVA